MLITHRPNPLPRFAAKPSAEDIEKARNSIKARQSVTDLIEQLQSTLGAKQPSQLSSTDLETAKRYRTQLTDKAAKSDSQSAFFEAIKLIFQSGFNSIKAIRDLPHGRKSSEGDVRHKVTGAQIRFIQPISGERRSDNQAAIDDRAAKKGYVKAEKKRDPDSPIFDSDHETALETAIHTATSDKDKDLLGQLKGHVSKRKRPKPS